MFQINTELSVVSKSAMITEISAVNTLIVGDITNNMVLLSAHYKVTSFLKRKNVYDSYFDIVQTPLRTAGGDPDEHETVVTEACNGNVSQVILFDLGVNSILDIGIRIAPFLHNGVKCIVFSNRSQDLIEESPHELLSIYNIGI